MSEEVIIGDNVADPLMARSILAMFDEILKESIAVDGWDIAPFLAFARLQDRTPVTPGMSFHSMSVELAAVPGTLEAFARAPRPHHVMLRMAEIVKEKGLQAPLDLLAVCMLTEGYMVSSTDAQEIANLMKAPNGAITAHPRRVECKILTAADVNGVIYAVYKPRDPAVDTAQFAGTPRDENRFGGLVPLSLLYLIKTTQGEKLPPWDDFLRIYD